MVVEIEGRPHAKRRRIELEERVVPASSCLKSSSSGTATHPSRFVTQTPTSSSVKIREKALLERERELNLRFIQVEDRLLHVLKREEELERRFAQDTIAQLEDHFACSLCYEIM